MNRIDDLKRQLAQLDELIKTGVLTGEAAGKARERLEAEVLAAVLQPGAAASAGAAPTGAAGEAKARPSRTLLFGVLAFVVVFGAAGYAWLGNRDGLAAQPGATGDVAAGNAAASAPHALGAAQIEAMAQRLADRLKDNPDDVEGWTMLGRSYGAMGRFPQALQAYQRVIDLRPKDAQAYADYADALGMVNGRKLEGEPEKFIAKALQLDADNAKALSLAGTVAFDKGDAALAARHWERAMQGVEPGSDMARQLQSALAEARQRAGLPPLASAGQAPMGAAAADPAGGSARPVDAKAAAAAAVQVSVTLAPALAAKAAPDDTVFIFARAQQGPKAPLAIQRRQVRDLPLELTLDDSMAMSPALRLSSQQQVVIGARITKSGNPMPQPGDMQGLSPVVAVGTRGVKVEIGEVVR